ncbi:hypothetical protein WI58_00520 [Burkholderia cepacia]|nr:hypothetical protein WI54_16735 [Burkholderia cepacia]KVB33794.1 hypothetical protein WI58_00520 [Burkholderia cepacia]
MITVGILAKIRRMYFREKVPLREIARRTGLSRNTVRSWLRQTDAVEPKYPKRVSPSVVDEWAAQLTGWERRVGEPITSARWQAASSRSLPYLRESDSNPRHARYPISGCGRFVSRCLTIVSAPGPTEAPQFSNLPGVHSM